MAVLAINAWHWLLLAVLLFCIELLVIPATYCLWLGVAAAAVGIMMLLLPELAFFFQIVIFTSLSVASLVIHKRYLKRNPPTSDEPALNRRGEQYIGRVFTLQEAIVNGVGKVKVDDSTWKVRGEDTAAGGRVRITGADGTVLLVQSADEG